MSGMPFLVYYSSEVKNMKPTAAKTVSSQLIYCNHGRKAASFFILLILACAATCVQATTYYWKGATGSSSYGDWSNLSNWSTESAGGADAAVALARRIRSMDSSIAPSISKDRSGLLVDGIPRAIGIATRCTSAMERSMLLVTS